MSEQNPSKVSVTIYDAWLKKTTETAGNCGLVKYKDTFYRRVAEAFGLAKMLYSFKAKSLCNSIKPTASNFDKEAFGRQC